MYVYIYYVYIPILSQHDTRTLCISTLVQPGSRASRAAPGTSPSKSQSPPTSPTAARASRKSVRVVRKVWWKRNWWLGRVT